MKSKYMKLLLIIGLIVFNCSTKQSDDSGGIDAQLKIVIGTDPSYPQHLQVILENSVYKAVFRINKEANGELEHAIRDWIIKSNQQDQVDNYIDACAQRPVCKSAELVYDSGDKKTVRFLFGDDEFILDYTIFPNSHVIKVDYVKYDNKQNFWCNTVEIGTPGGIEQRHQAVTKVYGQENYIREINYHEESYWNRFDGGEYEDDPGDGGALNYKNHIIMVVGNPDNGVGFGRVMPVYKKGERGGMRILKLLWDRGFETFPATGKQQTYRPQFTGYLFVFNNGLDNAIELGKAIVDGDMLVSR